MSTLRNNSSKMDDPRRERILEGAKQVFLAYGFSRTTMDDIARAVEISRPALYLLFRNKADIFRAVGQAFLDESRVSACRVLGSEGALDERLMEALDQSLFQLLRVVDDSPHGEEIIDVENSIAEDIVAGWRQSLVDGVATAIDEEARKRNVRLEDQGLSAQSLAEMLFDLLGGLKRRGLCLSHGEERARQFVTLVELALSRK